jgi:hypothetical protein
MKNKLNKAIIAFFVSAILLLCAIETLAQKDSTPKKRLTSPAVVKGVVGGEAHNSYVIRADKGQTMTVQISWRSKDSNRAEFMVSRSASFFDGAAVKFGKESDNGKSWRGKIPKSGNYYIYVVANPTANYTLKVTVK